MPAFIGIDWGTSNRRAYLLTEQGERLQQLHDGNGLLSIQNGEFEASLRHFLTPWQHADGQLPPILLSGMVGSRQGWLEVPYLTGPAPLGHLGHYLTPTPSATGLQACIVPGFAIDQQPTGPDVMRGEETQLLGALQLTGQLTGWYVLPGTHSKWIRVEQGCLTRLHTFMTGEWFQLLHQQGTLASLLDNNTQPDQDAFNAGLAEAGRHSLSRSAFGIRAKVLRGQLSPTAAEDYLSGLLIGAEWHSPDIHLLAGETVYLIGTHSLAMLYQHAAQQLGISTQLIDADQAYCQAITHLYHHYRETRA